MLYVNALSKIISVINMMFRVSMAQLFSLILSYYNSFLDQLIPTAIFLF